MGSKLTGNGRWEGSRMFLPEHKEAYLEFMNDLRRRERSELDEQARQIIALGIRDSMVHKMSATIRMYDSFEECLVIGVVERVDNLTRRIRVNGDWHVMDDIESVELSE